MTPAARVAAAIEVLDNVMGGVPAERVLTNWARSSRFAGSSDRAAVRDHVYDALRCRRSFAALGGALTGRGLMIGALRSAGRSPSEVFTGERHAPLPLSSDEARDPPSLAELPENVRLDCPDWLAPRLKEGLGEDFPEVLEVLRRRAPVFVRVNLSMVSRDEAMSALLEDAIASEPHPLSSTALKLSDGARRLRTSRAYRDGLVELQDAASQAVVDFLFPIEEGARILDYCAGGGGKALAIAAAAPGARVFAHDADSGRMRDLALRAQRAGASIAEVVTARLKDEAPYNLVLVDAPCSGSGAWRRQPEAKWTLTPERLTNLAAIQAGIFDRAMRLVAAHGTLAYATCSFLPEENEVAVAAFLSRTPGWRLVAKRRFSPLEGGDGFFVAILKRDLIS